MFLTLLWLVLGSIWVYLKQDAIPEITLHEAGDFMSGFFAPVAFLWLILGYMQQGEELKENTKALAQQKEEYSKSVKIAAYAAIVHYEINEVELLNSLGDQFKEGAKNARDRARQHKNKIELLLNELDC